MTAFITIRFLDILDIFLVAFLLYQLYRLIKGTVAFNIAVGLFSLYLFWLIVRALNMELLGSILGQFIGVGVLALIVVFHPEIRKFLVLIGSNYTLNHFFSLDKLFGSGKTKDINYEQINEITDACVAMSKSMTGALIVLTGNLELSDQINTGDKIDAKISSPLIRSVFFKNSPLHDGAIIIRDGRIVAAGCILPLTQQKLDISLGLRHRAAVGITENTDALSIVVSEERGAISVVQHGDIQQQLSIDELITVLEEFLLKED